MYCKNCGKEIDDKAYVCIHCGAKQEEDSHQITIVPPPQKEKNGFAITGFVFSFFSWTVIFGILSFIFSLVGCIKSRKPNVGGRGLAIVGLIFSTICLAAIAIIVINFGNALNELLPIFEQ